MTGFLSMLTKMQLHTLSPGQYQHYSHMARSSCTLHASKQRHRLTIAALPSSTFGFKAPESQIMDSGKREERLSQRAVSEAKSMATEFIRGDLFACISLPLSFSDDYWPANGREP